MNFTSIYCSYHLSISNRRNFDYLKCANPRMNDDRTINDAQLTGHTSTRPPIPARAIPEQIVDTHSFGVNRGKLPTTVRERLLGVD